MRPPSSVASATLRPAPSSPSRSASATRRPSNASSAVDEVCRPSLGISFETRQALAGARQERAHAAGARAARAREHDHRVGEAAVRDPGLGAVQQPVVAVALGARADAGGVAAGVGLGQRVAAELLAARERRQQARLLLGRAVALDRRHGQPGVHGDGDREAGVVARELLDDQAERRVIEPGAAVLLGHRHAEHAELGERAQRLHRHAMLAVPRGRVRCDLALAELAHERLHLALGVAELGDHAPNACTMAGMAESEPALRLDVPRAEALAHVAELIARAWDSFDQARPGAAARERAAARRRWPRRSRSGRRPCCRRSTRRRSCSTTRSRSRARASSPSWRRRASRSPCWATRSRPATTSTSPSSRARPISWSGRRSSGSARPSATRSRPGRSRAAARSPT